MPTLLRAAPWPALLGLSAAAAVTAAVAIGLASGPGRTVLHLSLALVAGSAACALDEPAAAVVRSCPMQRSKQALPRVTAATVPLLVGAVAVAAWWARTTPERLLLLELVGGWVLGLTLAAVARRWSDEPAEVVATGLVLLLATTLLVGPVGRRLALYGDGQRAAHVWWAVLAACLVAGLLLLRERRWQPR